MHFRVFTRAAACVLAALFFPSGFRTATAAALATNDTCADAMSVQGGGPFPYLTPMIDISNATTNGDPVPPPDCAADVTNGVWFKFTPAATALYTLSAGPDTLTDFGDGVNDSVMAVYTSTNDCDGFTLYGCNDEAFGFTFPNAAGISTNLTASTTYYIVVWVGGISASATRSQGINLQLRITKPTVPSNDTCAGAVIIPSGGPFPYLTPTHDTTLATPNDQPEDTGCTNGYRSVWYKFTPTSSGSYFFSTDTSTATTVGDTTMTLYQNSGGCGGTFTVYACNDNGEGRAAMTTNLVAGTTYYLVVWDKESGNVGETSLQIRVALPAAPSVTTLSAVSITSTSATLRALVNPNGLQSRFWFEWGTTTNYTSTNAAKLLNAGFTAITTNITRTDFNPATTYHFRAVATNLLGKTFGADQIWSNVRPLITSPVRQGNDFQFQFTGTASELYVVQGSTNLINWSDIGPATEIGSGSFQFIDHAGATPYRFYRVRLP